jgi:hypothetical protein
MFLGGGSLGDLVTEGSGLLGWWFTDAYMKMVVPA